MYSTNMILLVFIVIFIPSIFDKANGYRILAVFAHAGKSHFDVFGPYLEGLAIKDHELLVISHFPRSDPMPNYKDIDLVGTLPSNKTTNVLAFKDITYGGQVRSAFRLSNWGKMTCEKTFQNPKVKELIKSNETFDLLVTEQFMSDCMLAFGYKFKVPVIALSSCTFWPWTGARIGNPENPAYVPIIFQESSTKMDFSERLSNTFWYLFHKLHYNVLFNLPSHKISSESFGPSLPSISELAQNTSLIIGYKILAVFNHMGKSHFDPAEPFLEELAKRGHQLLVISHFPREKPFPNYRDIDLRGTMPINKTVNLIAFQDISGTDIQSALRLSHWGNLNCEKTLALPKVQNLINSKETFDLLIAETFNTDCFLSFAHKFNTPIIAYSSSAPLPWTPARIGLPDNPSYIPNHFAKSTDKMNFFERFVNAFWYTFHNLHPYFFMDAPSHKIATKYFGESLPPLSELAKKTSLLMVNSHFSINQARPFVPGAIEVAGIHIKPKKELPPAKSHFQAYDLFLQTLASRGHELFVISHFPRQKYISNYRDIDLNKNGNEDDVKMTNLTESECETYVRKEKRREIVDISILEVNNNSCQCTIYKCSSGDAILYNNHEVKTKISLSKDETRNCSGNCIRESRQQNCVVDKCDHINHYKRNIPNIRNNSHRLKASFVTKKCKPESVEVFNFDKIEGDDLLKGTLRRANVAMEACLKVLEHPGVKNISESNLKVDLIMIELFTSDCFLSIAHKLKAPIVALHTSSLLPWSNSRLGNPDNPSYIPVFFTSFSSQMGFYERLMNTVHYMFHNLAYVTVYDIPSYGLVREKFGNRVPPSSSDVAKTTSLFLVNSHFSLHSPRPLVPGVIEVAGIHIGLYKNLSQYTKMVTGTRIFTFGITILFTLQLAEFSKILVILPYEAKSHILTFSPYLQKLASRGHELLVLSRFPKTKPIPNYVDIDLRGLQNTSNQHSEDVSVFSFDNIQGDGLIKGIQRRINYATKACEGLFTHPDVKKLIESDSKFDLVVAELFVTDCFLTLAYKFKTPIVALETSCLVPWSNSRMGNVDNPSYIPVLFTSYTSKMKFMERTMNTVSYVVHNVLSEYLHIVLSTFKIASIVISAPRHTLFHFGLDSYKYRVLLANTCIESPVCAFRAILPERTMPVHDKKLVHQHLPRIRISKLGYCNMKCNAASIVAILTICLQTTNSSKILALFPHVGKSHQDVYDPFLKQLASRGHHVVVVSHFPQAQEIENLTDISIRGAVEIPPTQGITFGSVENKGSIHNAILLTNLATPHCDGILRLPQVKNLMNQSFDLVITELFDTDCFLGVVHQIKAPFMYFSSSVLMPWANDRFGNPDNPSYIPNLFVSNCDRMNFWERISNTIDTIVDKWIVFPLFFDKPGHAFAEKHLGISLPPLPEIAKQGSLILVNSHFSLNRPRPLVPAVVEVGGIHINKPPKELPQVVTRWSNDLHLRVSCTNCNHPKVRVFLAHGGLLGTIEAVHVGVPMVGIPMYGDQSTNIRMVEAAGMGIRLNYADITKESVLKALKTYKLVMLLATANRVLYCLE
ncbi:hypothetical protein C0J52_02575 [Blattella germanica]|nr:hypothetical protein C0J52_02575 [Blattella germanica]